ncbi:hypothetical protein H0266_05915 [Halobacillus locisalis]|uniref:Uncharacterized protein n=1 Tax=Halobacillus locisalis TaxID=220753 RepID=A0A838CR60_9BACI|nr:hypothetical protein [Halobacillus locisalis]MBA2174441.1 hypothetical protein [Halobacillus locisalis]
MKPSYTYEQATQEFGNMKTSRERTTITVDGGYSLGLKHRFYDYASNQKSYMIHPQTGKVKVIELKEAYWR